ncbi:MAG: recombinase family protein [Taibaiella sp.]|nr:recombinase family protein [Taibaiella sp.]MBX9449619.1 recombinase family protein [Taibaiella sp.]
MELTGLIADLYIRVSTDEQADKGYSQRSQEEALRKYCSIHHITIRRVMIEDYTARTFNRPEWTKYLADLRKNKRKSNLVLFVKWDRFSRITSDAYQMIAALKKLGVEPQATEQPLDLSIPENKIMLAFYLASPEVENDRRALNVIDGMRRARKEGRYMGLAPYGYINRSTEEARKYIAPKEPEANILQWVFREIAKGKYNADQIFRMAQKRGFSKQRAHFYTIVRNPVYCGKIHVPQYKDEESRYVKGLHEPIITEALFYDAQDVLDGRKRTFNLKVVANRSLPLRGFLLCPECGRVLTGSASKGYSKYYTYYHCQTGCSFRIRAEDVNEQFISQLKKIYPK